MIWAERGINNGKIDGVNGITFVNNVTDHSEFIRGVAGGKIDHLNSTNNATAINFLNESDRKYQLTSGSTDLVNKGSTKHYFPNTDFSRLRDATPDIGAFEYR